MEPVLQFRGEQVIGLQRGEMRGLLAKAITKVSQNASRTRTGFEIERVSRLSEKEVKGSNGAGTIYS